MSTGDSNTNEHLRRGSFADGQASSDLHPDDSDPGTFADGEADPEAYPREHHIATFAEGQAQPKTDGEHHEGTFGEGGASVTSHTQADRQ